MGACGFDKLAEARLAAEAGKLWRKREEHAQVTERWLHGITLEAREDCGGEATRLSAADALDLSIISHRYMLDPLAEAAHGLLIKALDADVAASAADVVPLLLRAQQEREEAACQAVLVWAVDHYELVREKLDLWLGQMATGLVVENEAVRRIGEPALFSLAESLREQMVRRRHGL